MNLILKCLSSRIYSFLPRLSHKYIPTLLFLFLFIFLAPSHIRKHGLSALHLAVFPELPFPCGTSLCSLGVPQCPAYCWPEIPERLLLCSSCVHYTRGKGRGGSRGAAEYAEVVRRRVSLICRRQLNLNPQIHSPRSPRLRVRKYPTTKSLSRFPIAGSG